MDPIADFLTRIRNAVKARHRIVEVPASNIKKEMTKVLYNKGFIQSYKFDDSSVQGTIKIALKYNPVTKEHTKAKELPHVLNGLGVAILSTSRGVITDKEARQLNVGGEVLCYVY